MEQLVADLRRFNRIWTHVLGLLDRGMLETDLTLTEARVLYELGQQPLIERQKLRLALGLDASYLTRILGRFERVGWVVSVRSKRDRRSFDLRLTDAGWEFVAELERRSSAEMATLVTPLSSEEMMTLGEALSVAASLVVPQSVSSQVVIRDARPGDYGWMISRHGAVYHEMFGWAEHFEGKVAQIVADYLATPQTGIEHAWIAEVDGARAGCILCCQRSANVAQLRILLVERWARGRGIGSQLIETCIAFAEQVGYTEIVLETDASLIPALRLYAAAGFRLTAARPEVVHGDPEDAQTWSLDLPRARH